MPEGAPEPLREQLLPGINLAGLFRSENGLGEAARLLVATVQESGIPFTTSTFLRSPSRQGHPFQDHGDGKPIYDINIVAVNADHITLFAQDIGPRFFRDRYTIGTWFWETDEFPPRLHGALEYVDEVWMSSEYSRRAVARATEKPTFVFPLPILEPDYPRDVTRADLGMPAGFTFLFAFDFMSAAKRKNPVGLVRAFKMAFTDDEGPRLVIKSANGWHRPDDMSELTREIGDRTDITLVDKYVPGGWVTAMIAQCDSYVSLSRAEGFGLTMAEAMILGKPTVATAYSGNLEFMTPANSYLVAATEVAVGPGTSIYPAGGRWGDPSLESAAAIMREIAADPAKARRRGAVARTDMLEKHSLNARSKLLRDRVETIRATSLPLRRDFGRGFESVRTIQKAALAIGSAPKIEVPVARGGLYGRAARLSRKIFGGMIIPYRHRQGEVDRLLHEAVAEQAHRLNRLERDLARSAADQSIK
ncbi:MAG: glycosyltransferase family 4 protein [Candidatus Dormibacteria bacterium]